MKQYVPMTHCLISLACGFDASFHSAEKLAKFWVRCTTARSAGSLADWVLEALSDHERVMTVCFYNESITDYDVKYSGQVWEHAPEQRVAASTFRWYSRGLRLAISQADDWPIPISLRCRSTCCNHEARGRPIGLLHSQDSLAERIW